MPPRLGQDQVGASPGVEARLKFAGSDTVLPYSVHVPRAAVEPDEDTAVGPLHRDVSRADAERLDKAATEQRAETKAQAIAAGISVGVASRISVRLCRKPAVCRFISAIYAFYRQSHCNRRRGKNR